MTTIIFSKDRAAQLDLLLRSAQRYAPDLVSADVYVLCAASDAPFWDAYEICREEHLEVRFLTETAFARNLYELLKDAQRHVMFLCDDDVFYQPLQDPHPSTILDWRHDVLTVSLRLGRNTSECYSLNREQGLPPFDEVQRHAMIWPWRGQEADWGYPGSLDGNVWRTGEVLSIFENYEPTGPNNFEDILNGQSQHWGRNLAACYLQSILVGVPVNIVNKTHTSNRHGEQFLQPISTLNQAYLDGRRLSIDSIRPEEIDAAHCEQRLVYAA